MLKKRTLGKTELEIPEIGMGCWAIGGEGYGPTRDEESMAAFEAAWEGGVRFFDTADCYGKGKSETLISEFLKNKPRTEAIIATKAGVDFYGDGGHKKNFSLPYLIFACEQSLKRLGVETIDLFQLHNPNLGQLLSGEAVGLLAQLKKEGKIRHIGVSVHTRAEAFAAMDDNRVEVLQLIFNLLDQRMAEEVFQAAAQKNIGILVREPLASGLLSGRYDPTHIFLKTDHRARWQAEKRQADFEKISKIKNVLKDKPLSIAALEFALSASAVSCIIPGAKTPSQIKENLRAGNKTVLESEQIQELRDLFMHDPLFEKHLLPSQ